MANKRQRRINGKLKEWVYSAQCGQTFLVDEPARAMQFALANAKRRKLWWMRGEIAAIAKTDESCYLLKVN